MREAKRAGGARYCLFNQAMQERASRRGIMERDLRHALSSAELFVVYQPIMDLTSGHCTGVEAAGRWSHPCEASCTPGNS